MDGETDDWEDRRMDGGSGTWVEKWMVGAERKRGRMDGRMGGGREGCSPNEVLNTGSSSVPRGLGILGPSPGQLFCAPLQVDISTYLACAGPWGQGDTHEKGCFVESVLRK